MAGADEVMHTNGDELENPFTDGALRAACEAAKREEASRIPTERPSTAHAQALRDLRTDLAELLEYQPKNFDIPDVDTQIQQDLTKLCTATLNLHDYEICGGRTHPMTKEAYGKICRYFVQLAVYFSLSFDEAAETSMGLLESHDDAGCSGNECNVANELRREASAAREKASEVRAWVMRLHDSANMTGEELFGPEPEDTSTSLTPAALLE